jgi:NAD(P)-dependent dehydrogenase (short-subunit alcohol dehydrogenase family)
MQHEALASSVAIVTGGGRGIGRAVTLALAGDGAWVIPVSRTRQEVEAVAVEAAQGTGRASAMVADVTQESEVTQLISDVLGLCGRLDLLVNNVGLGLRQPFAHTTLAEWDMMWRANLLSAVLCTRAVLPAMLTQGSGHIINIASRAGRRGEANMSAYSAAKAGLIALTQSLAAELGGSGVLFSAVCPGPVSTRRVRLANPSADHSAWLAPSDVATAVLQLARSNAASVNGTVLDLFSDR